MLTNWRGKLLKICILLWQLPNPCIHGIVAAPIALFKPHTLLESLGAARATRTQSYIGTDSSNS